MRLRRTLYRVHIWLGWLIGVPLLFWTISGLWMAARPIDEVRGKALRAEPLPLVLGDRISAPLVGARAVKALTLEQQPDGTRWIVTFADGGMARADAHSGNLLPPVARPEAMAITRVAFAGSAKLETMSRFDVDHVPLDIRRERPAWQAHFSDGTNVYIDTDTGQLLALRTNQWRLYDWMWGLHIMDLQTRENSSHAILILFAALAGVGMVLALIQLPISALRRR